MPNIADLRDIDRFLRANLPSPEAPVFYRQWMSATQLLSDKQILASYVRLDSSDRYTNVAVATDSLLIDIEAKEDGTTAYYTVQRVADIGKLLLSSTALAGLPESSGARLVLWLSQRGSEGGSHWIAVTEAEMRDLEAFATSLAKLL